MKVTNEVYYFKIIPKKIHVHKSIVYNVHLLTKFKVIVEKNSSFHDSMDQWIYAGSQHGVIEIDSRPLEIVYEDNQQKISVFTLKLMQIQHKVQKDMEIITKKIDKQEFVGKQVLFLKSYIAKFKSDNIHYFLQKTNISAQFTLEYDVFLEKTVEALQRIIFQHENINKKIRFGNNSLEQSAQSDDFSDQINEVEVKGENRLTNDVAFISQDALLRSQGKISSQDYIFTSLNKKKDKRIVRSKDSSVHVKLEERFMTDVQNTNKKPQQSQQHKKNEASTLHKSIVLKKLSSYKVKPGKIELLSPKKLKAKSNRIKTILYDTGNKLESDQQKRKRLMDDFQRKRLQFKRKIIENKQTENQPSNPLTSRNPQRNLSRYSSTMSMRTVRLSQWQKLPQKQPWVKKQKQITQVRNKKLLYFIVFFMLIVLYFLMQPFKNIESSLTANEIQSQQKTRQSEIKGDKKKVQFKIKSF